MSVGSSSARRHNAARVVAQRRWDDWRSEWPLQFIILPVLVAFAFCLVLFLGSKHGTRLAAIRTWLPVNPTCKSIKCAKAIAVDSQGGTLSSVAAAGTSGQLATSGAGLQTALSGITGLLGLETARVQPPAPVVLHDLGVMELDAEAQAKFDFSRWLWEAERLVGQQSRDCDTAYGLSYIDQWRKARIDWCNADGAGAAASVAASPKVTPGGGSSVAAPAAASSVGGRLLLGGRLLAESKASHGSASSSSSSGSQTSSGGGGGSSSGSRSGGKGSSSDSSSGKGAKSYSAGTAGGSSKSAAAQTTPVDSSIALYPFHEKEAYLLFAAAKNTVVDSKSFLGGLPAGLPEARGGTYRAACRLDNDTTPSSEFMTKADATRRWVVDALHSQEYGNVSAACAISSSAASSLSRTQGPVLHPVMVLTRLDPTNAFRTVEEAVTTFASLAVLNDPQIEKKGLQVAIADGKTDGFYLDLWARLSHPYPLRLLYQAPWAPNTCLTQVVHNGFSGSSILTSMGIAKRTSCKSTVVVAAALWLRHILAPAIQSSARSSFSSVQNKGVTRKTVVWISRRNFEGLAQNNLTPWQDQRRFSNEGEVVLELQREVWRWNDEACLRNGLPKSFGSHRRQRSLRRLQSALRGGPRGRAGAEAEAATGTLYEEEEDAFRGAAALTSADSGVDVAAGTDQQRRRLAGAPRCRQSNAFFDLRVIELNDLPFYPDNIQVLGQATILAGAHGTGLANMIWMPPARSGVLELHHNSAGNDHYHNMAHLLGHKYVNVESDGDRVELPAAAEGLRKLLDMLGS